MSEKRQGVIYVISAPSGAGKTTLCNQIRSLFPDLKMSISYTTRPMRAGEVDGVDYHFVSSDRFEELIDQGAFAEWAQVHDNYYGTALKTLDEATNAGHDILLDIDCQGAAQLKESLAHAVFIFILPPDFDELKRRLVGRQTDAPEVVARRIENARKEVREASWYDYIVVNDNFDFALAQLKAILLAETCRVQIVLPTVKSIIENES